jgi:hypothetical protein
VLAGGDGPTGLQLNEMSGEESDFLSRPTQCLRRTEALMSSFEQSTRTRVAFVVEFLIFGKIHKM